MRRREVPVSFLVADLSSPPHTLPCFQLQITLLLLLLLLLLTSALDNPCNLFFCVVWLGFGASSDAALDF